MQISSAIYIYFAECRSNRMKTERRYVRVILAQSARMRWCLSAGLGSDDGRIAKEDTCPRGSAAVPLKEVMCGRWKCGLVGNTIVWARCPKESARRSTFYRTNCASSNEHIYIVEVVWYDTYIRNRLRASLGICIRRVPHIYSRCNPSMKESHHRGYIVLNIYVYGTSPRREQKRK